MGVIKTIDLVGVSSESWRDAAQQALAEAREDDPWHRRHGHLGDERRRG